MALRKGTYGNDTLAGTSVLDYIYGYFGNDTLSGLGGNDRIYGGDGNDRLDGGVGNDLLFGGSGADNILGGAGNDTIDTGAQFIFGGSRDTAIDRVDAGAGDDQVSIARNDIALGGTGKDTLLVRQADFAATEVVKLNFANIGSSTATAIGLVGTSYAGTKAGQFENAAFFGVADGGSSIVGSRGDDIFSLDTSFGGVGTAGVSIAGGAGHDRITGSVKNDTLKGDAGDDIITGGTGLDVLTGGTGHDVFVFNTAFSFASSGTDRITDFRLTDDVIAIGVSNSEDFGSGAQLLQKGANPVNGTTAQGIAQVLYNTTTGVLSIDFDGSDTDAPVAIATLVGRPNITVSHLMVEYSDILIT